MNLTKLMPVLLSVPLLVGLTSFNNVKSDKISLGDEIVKDNISYTVTGYDTCYVSKYYGNDAVIEIPSIIKNDKYTFNVTAVGAEAFSNNLNIREVTIPSSVTMLQQSSFSDCNNLEVVNFPDTFVYVDLFAFINTNIKEIDLKCGYLANSCISSDSLEKISVGELKYSNLFELDYDRFLNNVREIKVPKDTSVIRFGFEGMMYLSDFYIPNPDIICFGDMPILGDNIYFDTTLDKLTNDHPNSIANIYLNHNYFENIYYKDASNQYVKLVK